MSPPSPSYTQRNWSWEKPDDLPKGHILKSVTDKKELRLFHTNIWQTASFLTGFPHPLSPPPPTTALPQGRHLESLPKQCFLFPCRTEPALASVRDEQLHLKVTITTTTVIKPADLQTEHFKKEYREITCKIIAICCIPKL